MQVDEMPEPRPPRAATADRGSVRRRVKALDKSRVRETATSAMIVLVLAIGVVSNLPDAEITRTVSRVVDPITLALGLDQNWSMYAPDPPRRQEDIEVRIAMADDSEKVWTPPRLNPVFGVAFSHRWRRFKESLVADEQIRPGFVHWVIREMTGPGDRPVHVDMLLRTEDIPPPGVSGPGQTAVQRLYSENLTENR